MNWKNILVYICTGIFFVVSVFLFFRYLELRESNKQLLAQLMQKDSVVVINNQTISKLTYQLDLNKVEFDKQIADLFKEMHDKYNQQVLAYIKVNAKYQAFKDSINTRDSTIINLDNLFTSVRTFDEWVVPQELRVVGWFEKQDPFSISFTNITLNLHPTILLSRSADKPFWMTTVKSNSDFLKPENIDVVVDDQLQIEDPWSYTLGVGGGNGVGLLAGVGYKKFSLYGNMIGGKNLNYVIGIMKTW